MFLTVTSTSADLEIQKHLTSIHIEEWLREDVLHFKWWLLLGLILAALLVWWNMLDKSRLHETLLYAALTTIVSLGICEYGEELTLWDYPADIIPIFSPLTSINLIGLSLLYSLVYQYFNTWKSFIVASVIVTSVSCFIIEPLLVWGGLYQLLKWKHYYSLPVYFAASLCIRAITSKIYSVTQSYENNNH